MPMSSEEKLACDTLKNAFVTDRTGFMLALAVHEMSVSGAARIEISTKPVAGEVKSLLVATMDRETIRRVQALLREIDKENEQRTSKTPSSKSGKGNTND